MRIKEGCLHTAITQAVRGIHDRQTSIMGGCILQPCSLEAQIAYFEESLTMSQFHQLVGGGLVVFRIITIGYDGLHRVGISCYLFHKETQGFYTGQQQWFFLCLRSRLAAGDHAKRHTGYNGKEGTEKGKCLHGVVLADISGFLRGISVSTPAFCRTRVSQEG